MTSGTAALAYSLYLGKRRGYGTPKLACTYSGLMFLRVHIYIDMLRSR